MVLNFFTLCCELFKIGFDRVEATGVPHLAGALIWAPSGWFTALYYVGGLAALWLIIVCGLLPGDKGPNKYGQSPASLRGGA